MARTPAARQSRLLFYTVSALGLVLVLLTTLVYSTAHEPYSPNAPGCRGILMYPSYARIKGFDETHTRFASKYLLYLYREQGKDALPEALPQGYLKGTPVLFIPGNAGTFKQGRSLAAEAAYLYYDTYATAPGETPNPNAQNMDFFMADFNEDFTAFHGRTLLDQAVYVNDAIAFILSLYTLTGAPTAVLVIGHSMGGIVSRVLFSLPNYKENSVNTVITLSSPHAASPLTFDGDLTQIYSATDTFWRHGFANGTGAVHETARRRLANVSLISITGGILDTILPADYTSLVNLVPASNGFTVFTTGIPGVWTPIDHLAIVWCDQLRKKLVAALMEIVDRTSPLRTYPLATRMAVMRRHLLSGFEDYASQDFSATRLGYTHRVRLDAALMRQPGVRTLRNTGALVPVNVFPIPRDAPHAFSMLTSRPVVPVAALTEPKPGVAILLCRTVPVSPANLPLVDYTKDTTAKVVELACVDVVSDAHAVPRSSDGVNVLADSSIGGTAAPFTALQFNASITTAFDVVVVHDSLVASSVPDDFLVAELALEASSHHRAGKRGLWSLMVFGAEVSLPMGRPLCVNIAVPSAWSSLLAYRVEFGNLRPGAEAALFEPFARQWIPGTHETKWHIALHRRNVFSASIHGVGPYVAFLPVPSSLNLLLWSDAAADDSPIDLRVTVDWWGTLRLLVVRFRLVVAAFPVGVVALVMVLQFSAYTASSVFPPFGATLLRLGEPRLLLSAVVLLAAATPLCSIRAVQRVLCLVNLAGWMDANEALFSTDPLTYLINTLFLGIHEKPLFFLGPLFYASSVALVGAVHCLVWGLCSLGVGAWVLAHRVLARVMSPLMGGEAVHGRSRRRVVGTLLLLMAVPFYIPYQLAYVVCCVLQAIVTMRVVFSESQRLGSSVSAVNVSNYNVSVLLLMLFVLPVNVPVLVVWLHNFSVQWTTPFSSHHNFLACMPIVLLVEKHMAGTIMPKPSALAAGVIKAMLAYMAFFAFMFGVRHTFWLHHLFNFVSVWLLVLFYMHPDPVTEQGDPPVKLL